jgi:hypothetical protein
MEARMNAVPHRSKAERLDGEAFETRYRYDRGQLAGRTGNLEMHACTRLGDGGPRRLWIWGLRRIAHGDALAAAVARFGVNLAGALEAIHRAGTIHGGLEPAQVGVDPLGRVRIVGFPLSCTTGMPRQAGVTFGGWRAMHYNAPEQVFGGPVTPATDLYALGAVLYELLTGEPPTARGSLAEVLESLKGPVPELPPCEGRPAALDAFVRRCLARDPAQRPASAGEARKVLEAILDTVEAEETAQVFSSGQVTVQRPAEPDLLQDSAVDGALGTQAREEAARQSSKRAALRALATGRAPIDLRGEVPNLRTRIAPWLVAAGLLAAGWWVGKLTAERPADAVGQAPAAATSAMLAERRPDRR